MIVLNSECLEIDGCDPDSPQGRWLATQLDASPRCTLVAYHRPRFSSGAEHGDDPALHPLWEQLADGGVDVVLNGHDHDYERFRPATPTAEVGRGPVQFVVGTGGRDLRDFTRDPERGSAGAMDGLGRRAGDDPAARRLRLALRRPGRHPARRQRHGDLPGTVGGPGWLNGLSRSGAGSPLDAGDPGPHREESPCAKAFTPHT